jgi:hypothetical protein
MNKFVVKLLCNTSIYKIELLQQRPSTDKYDV